MNKLYCIRVPQLEDRQQQVYKFTYREFIETKDRLKKEGINFTSWTEEKQENFIEEW